MICEILSLSITLKLQSNYPSLSRVFTVYTSVIRVTTSLESLYATDAALQLSYMTCIDLNTNIPFIKSGATFTDSIIFPTLCYLSSDGNVCYNFIVFMSLA